VGSVRGVRGALGVRGARLLEAIGDVHVGRFRAILDCRLDTQLLDERLDDLAPELEGEAVVEAPVQLAEEPLCGVEVGFCALGAAEALVEPFQSLGEILALFLDGVELLVEGVVVQPFPAV
jgi:hypothetical protein